MTGSHEVRGSIPLGSTIGAQSMFDWRLGSACLLGGALFGTASSGCGPRDVNLRSVLNEGAANEVAVLDEYEREELRLSGIVVRTGVKKQKRIVAAVHHADGISAQTAQLQTAFVLLAPEDEGRGRAVCFFGRDERSAVAPLARGHRVRVVGRFQEFGTTKAGVPTLVLNRCEIEE